jgi:predicted alpha/beta superfamily hydrolase
MRNRFIFLLFLICAIPFSTIAQITVTGVVIDSNSKAILPFVNIGIKHKNIGTNSLVDGTFSIQIPAQNENDTLTFSMIGYEESFFSIKTISDSQQKKFQLKPKALELGVVSISTKKLVEKKFGIKNSNSAIHFTDGSTNQNDIFEIAQVIKLDTVLSKITSVNLNITEPRNDSRTFRINFYDFDGHQPTNRIIEKSIVQTHPIKPGWLKFDLTQYGVYLKGNVVVAIEFIPNEKKENPIYYEIKIGGSSNSFVRTSSQGEWTIPPHHYCLFITALVPDNKTKFEQIDSEEKETIPTSILFSEFVKDSFSIFIQLPKDYNKKKAQLFPVIYLLDGNAYFDIVSHLLNEKNLTDAILVGVGYKDFLLMDSLRNRDYTFPKALPEDSFSISGGADKFLAFIELELIPFMDKTYRTDTTDRTLMGHSLGGYFTLYVLEEAINKKQDFFKNYVAASPSLDYCNQYIPKQFQKVTNYQDTIQRILFLSFGGREDSEDGGTGTAGIDNFNLFTELLSENRFKNIKVKSEVYPNFGHMETAIPTFMKALILIK